MKERKCNEAAIFSLLGCCRKLNHIPDNFRTVLVEVTSSRTLADCKLVLDTLLSEMVALQGGQLKVVQGRVVGEEGELRVTYPSKTDLVEVRGLSVVRD